MPEKQCSDWTRQTRTWVKIYSSVRPRGSHGKISSYALFPRFIFHDITTGMWAEKTDSPVTTAASNSQPSDGNKLVSVEFASGQNSNVLLCKEPPASPRRCFWFLVRVQDQIGPQLPLKYSPWDGNTGHLSPKYSVSSIVPSSRSIVTGHVTLFSQVAPFPSPGSGLVPMESRFLSTSASVCCETDQSGFLFPSTGLAAWKQLKLCSEARGQQPFEWQHWNNGLPSVSPL